MATKSKTVRIGQYALGVAAACACVAGAERAWAQAIGLKRLDEMMIATPAKVERGKEIYAQQCVTCHGPRGANGTDWARENGLEAGGWADGSWEYGGGVAQNYQIISRAIEGITHPVFYYVPYQDRWAVSHYIRTQAPGGGGLDSDIVRAAVRKDAVEGVCRDKIRAGLADRVKPKGEEQLELGEKLYVENCVSCHGAEGKGEGPAGAGLNPPPRNFHVENADAWYRGSSPFAIFQTLTVGARGSMAAYNNLSEDERWALTHYVREWIPESARQDAGPAEITAACRSLSAPPKPDSIPIEAAMRFLIADAPERRALERAAASEPIYRYEGADATRGQVLWNQSCAECHGARGEGTRPIGPYGATPPYLYLSVTPMQKSSASGRSRSFAERSLYGAHTTLPDMSGAAVWSERQWRDVQAFVATFDGEARFAQASAPVELGAPALTLVADAVGNYRIGQELVTMQNLDALLAARGIKGGQGSSAAIMLPTGDADEERVAQMVNALKLLGFERVELIRQGADSTPEARTVNRQVENTPGATMPPPEADPEPIVRPDSVEPAPVEVQVDGAEP